MGFILLGAGLFSIVATILKPNFYWNNRKALMLRKVFGDMGTSIFYFALGGFLTVVGILELFNVITMK